MATRKIKIKRLKRLWYSDKVVALAFERDAKKEYASLESKNRIVDKYRWREYTLTIDLREYEERKVKIRFNPVESISPRITVDGPKESPHRYKGGKLCIWYPKDPVERRWTFDDGLLELLVMIEAHLYREAWWRETGGYTNGEWLGSEVPH